MILWLDRISLALTLALSVFILHGRGIAEILIGLVDAAFLVRCALTGDWAWLRTPWLKFAVAWWGWLILCSLPFMGIGGIGSLVQAVVVGRFLLFVAALEHQVLRPAGAQKWLQRVLAASAIYIAAQSWLQFAIGRKVA